MAFIRGYHFSNTSFFPPTMTESVPSTAFGSPPLTGASSISIPFSASRAAISRLARGAIELMSMTVLPGAPPSRMPFCPSTTAFTCGEFGSMVMMTSQACATSFGDEAVAAPKPDSSFIGASLMSWTTRPYPALIRFFDIGLPMIPRPINPVFIASSPSFRPYPRDAKISRS